MKKLFLGLFLAFASVATFAQLDGVTIEEIDASQIGPGFVTYRIFVDMAPGQELVSVGATNTNPIIFETTTSWYNETTVGSFNAEAITIAPTFGFPYNPTSNSYYDSYIALGSVGGPNFPSTQYQAVPLTEDTDGTVDGILEGSSASANATPLATTDNAGWNASLASANGVSFSNEAISYYTTGGIAGAGASNSVLIAQLTTDGYVNIELGNVLIKTAGTTQGTTYVTRFPAGTEVATDQLTFNNAPNPAPTVSFDAPASGTTVNKGDVVDFVISSADNSAVASIELLIDGISYQTVANPAATETISWTVPGGVTASVEVIATDDMGKTNLQAVPAAPAVISLSINDPFPTMVSVEAPTAGTYNFNAITLTATATDGDEGISGLEFQVAGQTIPGTATATPGEYTATFTPSSAGSFQVIAIATSGVGAIQASSPVAIVIVNEAPSAAIVSPATPFALYTGNDTLIEVDATDADGSIVSVAFYVNGSLATTVTSAPFQFNYVAPSTPVANVNIEAVATDNGGATASDEIDFQVTFQPTSDKYRISPVVDFCSASDVFCLPIITTGATTDATFGDVTGYDLVVKFDPGKVTPTGNVISGEELVADRDFTNYRLNQVDDSTLLIGFWLNEDAPSSYFVGTAEGQELLCVEFSRNSSFGDEDVAEFSIPLVDESFDNVVVPTSAGTGSYTTIKETNFNGNVSFWSDNSPIADNANANLDIFGDVNPGVVVHTNADGDFTYDITNGTNITIERDIDASVDVQAFISGQDAYYASLVVVEETSYSPNAYEIIAMDVNRDGRVSSGDITQMQQRTVGNIDEFSSQTDWVFVAKSQLLNDFSYRRSTSYPAYDGIGYNKNHVPAVSDLIELVSLGIVENPNDCPVISTEDFKGIVLGDVTGNYAAQPATAGLKSGEVELTASFEVVAGQTFITIAANTDKAITAYDFSFEFNPVAYNFVEATNLSSGMIVSANAKDDLMKVSAYAQGVKAKSGKLVKLTFEGEMDYDEVELVLSTINEEAVQAIATEGETVTSVDAITLAVSVSPNPAVNVVTVTAEAGVASLIANNGAILAESTLVGGQTSFDVSALAPATYTVKVVNGDASGSTTIVVE